MNKQTENKKINFILYYIWSIIWDSLTNIIGLLIAIPLVLTKHKVLMFGPKICIIVGNSWGGLSLGIFTFVSLNSSISYHTMAHEFGHSLQGLILGPLWIFIVGMPSSFRYWYRVLIKKIKPNKQLPPYDSVWFERTATKYGKKYSNTRWLI